LFCSLCVCRRLSSSVVCRRLRGVVRSAKLLVPVFLGKFFTLYVPIKIGMNSYKIYNFTLTVCSLVAMVSAVRDDRGRPLPACSAFDCWLCATFAESRPMFAFSVFVRVFRDESSGRKSFRFPQVLIKILSSELNVFPH